MIVVDTSAIIAIIQSEPDAGQLMLTISAAANLAIAAPTMLEAHIVASSRFPVEGADLVRDLIDGSKITVIPFDAAQADIAGAWRRYGRGSGSPARLNFGDCFSYALALSLGAPLLFKGDDFGHTDVELVRVA
ncbi:type II toxin-antitoxin system VapC family toxin [Jiella sp. M17.18]|uniref:type II toxin-antitoxin system VapC family toxin n=1 Tax=Jiella sp. M17.18 TaxID=3234247 RepID=UPI0034DDE9BB